MSAVNSSFDFVLIQEKKLKICMHKYFTLQQIFKRRYCKITLQPLARNKTVHTVYHVVSVNVKIIETGTTEESAQRKSYFLLKFDKNLR